MVTKQTFLIISPGGLKGQHVFLSEYESKYDVQGDWDESLVFEFEEGVEIYKQMRKAFDKNAPEVEGQQVLTEVHHKLDSVEFQQVERYCSNNSVSFETSGLSLTLDDNPSGVLKEMVSSGVIGEGVLSKLDYYEKLGIVASTFTFYC